MGMEKEEAMQAAARLVDEVILEAEAEAMRRKKEAAEQNAKNVNNVEDEGTGISAIIKRGTRLQTRARGFVTRLLTQLRILINQPPQRAYSDQDGPVHTPSNLGHSF